MGSLLVINPDGLKKNVKPLLRKAANSLGSAKSILSQIRYPDGFYYAGAMSGYIQVLEETQRQMEQVSLQIDSIISDFQNAENKNLSLAGLVGNLHVNYKFNVSRYNKNKLNFWDDFFRKHLFSGGYGIDQGLFTKFVQSRYTYTIEYEENGEIKKETKYFQYKPNEEDIASLFPGKKITKITEQKSNYTKGVEYLMTQYGMSQRDARRLLEYIDQGSGGVCSYAALANVTLQQYYSDPVGFENKFGFGFSGSKTLLDIIINLNNGGMLYQTPNGSWKFNNNYRRTDLAYNTTGYDWTKILAYLNSKNVKVNNYGNIEWNGWISTDNFATVRDKYSMDEIVTNVGSGLSSGVSFVLHYGSDESTIRLTSANNPDKVIICSEAHTVAITGMTSTGFIVTSWGEKWIVPFLDLKNSGQFTIDYIDINENSGWNVAFG